MNTPGIKFGLVALGLAALISPISAAAQVACEPYTVKAGDTLATISETAYGSRDYQIIFNANRNVIAGNPNNLTPGTVLNLPCADGRLTAASQFNEVVEREEEKAAKIKARNVYEPPIRLLADNDWAPYTDEGLSGGGFLMRLSTTALHRAGNKREYNQGWVNDFNSHLYTLLPAGAYDIAVAWVVPDCAKKPRCHG